MVKLARKWLRYLLQIRINESIEDGVRRIICSVMRKFPYKKIYVNDLKKDLSQIGLKQGDVVIVHSSWRGMYALECTPSCFIDVIMEVIGETGTLVMPCYGVEGFLDVHNTKSSVGILSEILRNKKDAVRSCFPKFSMVAYGKLAHEITSGHFNSIYQFDELSPYYIAAKKYDAKVLLVGLGEYSHKISIFHCATYQCRKAVPFYGNCFKKRCTGHILNGEDDLLVNYLDRIDNCSNDKIAFLKLFFRIPKSVVKKRGYSLVLFDANVAFNIAMNFCLNGGRLYKIN